MTTGQHQSSPFPSIPFNLYTLYPSGFFLPTFNPQPPLSFSLSFSHRSQTHLPPPPSIHSHSFPFTSIAHTQTLSYPRHSLSSAIPFIAIFLSPRYSYTLSSILFVVYCSKQILCHISLCLICSLPQKYLPLGSNNLSRWYQNI